LVAKPRKKEIAALAYQSGKIAVGPRAKKKSFGSWLNSSC